METEIQAYMDEMSLLSNFGLSVGVVDSTGRSFGLGSGTRTPKGLP